MANELITNFPVSTVATAPSPATSGTSLSVQSGHGARFPSTGTTSYSCVVCPADATPTADNAEIVRVTARSSDAFTTIIRQHESSPQRSIQVGDRIFQVDTAAIWQALWDAVDGKQPLDAELSALASVTSAADKLPYFDGSGSAAVTNFTAAGRAILDDADAAAQRTTLDVPSNAESTFAINSAVGNALAGYVPINNPLLANRAAGGAQLTDAAFISSGGFATSATNTPILFVIPLFAADMDLAGRTTKLKTRLVVMTNTTAPTISFTVGLSLITGSAGGANAINPTWGAPVSGSTVTVTTPAADSIVNAVSVTPYMKPADGNYVLTLSTSGAMPATNPRVQISPSLWMTHV